MGHPYRDTNGWPCLHTSWVLYLDALGTKEEAKTLTNAKLFELTNAEAWYQRFLHRHELDEAQQSAHFTDDVVVARPDTSDDCADSLQGFYEMLHSVGAYLVGMALDSGRAVRGGLARGPACIDRNPQGKDGAAPFQIVHGEGLVQAVLLEKDAALVPRVVVGPAVLERIEFCVGHPDAEPESFVVRSPGLLRDTRDGAVFIDHLGQVLSDGSPSELVRDAVGEPMATAQILEGYREFVLRGLDGPAAGKYVWLGEYFDSVVARFGIGTPIGTESLDLFESVPGGV